MAAQSAREAMRKELHDVHNQLHVAQMAAPSDAQLRAENQKLREQVRQLAKMLSDACA